MTIKFDSLALQWKLDREVLDLRHQVLFFHGQISAGKSTIARIIDFCLGGTLEMTIALQREFISSTLAARVGKHDVLFERSANSDAIQVSWKNDDLESATVLAPIQSRKGEIWPGGIETFSDLMFLLLGIEPLRVKRSKIDEDSPLIRLSFRNFMWYCYLEQEHLDSSFYRLEDPIRANSSKDVMRFVFGYYSEKLSKLESQLEACKTERGRKLGTANELRAFLQRFGYGSMEAIEQEIISMKRELEEETGKRSVLEQNYQVETHSSDDLRESIRKLIPSIESQEQSITDLKERIGEQKSLRAELFASKFKLAKVESANQVFSNVKFDLCPACGTKVSVNTTGESCYLCHQVVATDAELPLAEGMRLDIDGRLTEIELSIRQHEVVLQAQEKKLRNLLEQKRGLDMELQSQLRHYDSAFLSRFREVDRNIATIEERLKGFEKIKLMPAEIGNLEQEADQLHAQESRLKREIENEKSTLTKAADYIRELEETFVQTLNSIKLPVMAEGDIAKINLKTWDVQILHQGVLDFPWNFYNAGSGGVKTLFNVCYLLSIHVVAARNKLPLPTFIMIDTPMQNIGENVNKELFENFYEYLYTLAEGPLEGTQFIIIDKDFVTPKSVSLDIYDRYMTPDQDAHPPLIKYFRLNPRPDGSENIG